MLLYSVASSGGLISGMTQLLERAIDAVRRLEPEDQDRIAGLMLNCASEDEAEDIDPEHLPDVLESVAQMERGEFATEEEVAAAFARFGK